MTASHRPLWVVVTCMDRLSSLEKTLPAVLDRVDGNYCLVDFSCPSASGDWVTRRFPLQHGQERLVVVRVAGQQRFHKTKALNIGARHALERGAEYLCFFDADTLPDPMFDRWLHASLAPNRFLVTLRARSSFGFLVVPAQQFVRLGGFDERIQNYGGEDIEMRLRLYLLGGLEYVDAPGNLLRVFNHPDELRTRHYEVVDRQRSNTMNLAYVKSKVRMWTGRELGSLGLNVRRLYRVDSNDLLPPGPSLTLPFEISGSAGAGWSERLELQTEPASKTPAGTQRAGR